MKNKEIVSIIIGAGLVALMIFASGYARDGGGGGGELCGAGLCKPGDIECKPSSCVPPLIGIPYYDHNRNGRYDVGDSYNSNVCKINGSSTFTVEQGADINIKFTWSPPISVSASIDHRTVIGDNVGSVSYNTKNLAPGNYSFISYKTVVSRHASFVVPNPADYIACTATLIVTPKINKCPNGAIYPDCNRCLDVVCPSAQIYTNGKCVNKSATSTSGN